MTKKLNIMELKLYQSFSGKTLLPLTEYLKKNKVRID